MPTSGICYSFASHACPQKSICRLRKREQKDLQNLAEQTIPQNWQQIEF